MVLEQNVVDVYSDQEVAKLESEVRNLEDKNNRLRDVLTNMGVSTIGVETGSIWYEENEKIVTE